MVGTESLSSLRIALSVDSLSPGLTGIGRYCLELCNNLSQDPEISNLSYFLGVNPVPDPRALVEGRFRRTGPFRRMPAWGRRIAIRSSLRRFLVHGPNFFLPDWADSGVITVHDLSVLMLAHMHPQDRIAAFERDFVRSVGRAVRIITPTEAVKREVMEWAGVADDRVVAVPMGVSADYRSRKHEELAPSLAQIGLKPDAFALCVATFEPRKRIDKLIAAWRLLPRVLRNTYPLVLVGGGGWHNEQLLQDMREAQGEGWLHVLGYVHEAQLPLIYAGARLFIYPSAYEGFGLPPLEAMRSGIPVVAANIASVAEVTRGAAILVDPDDVERFATQLAQCIEDRGWRENASKSGLEVASTYSWKRCARETLKVYREASA